MKDWFKDWFESDLYLKVYQHRDNQDAEKLLNLIFSEIEIIDNAGILDAACGAGRHSSFLAKRGYNVSAFDLSQNLLNAAKDRAQKENLIIDFFRSDMRDVKFTRNFDLILNLFTSFGYFENDDENFAFPKTAFNFLNDNGYFVLDFLNKDYLISHLVPNSSRIIDNIEIKESREIKNNRVIKKMEISDGVNTHEFFESVKLYSMEEITSQFKAIGFNLILLFGDYNGGEYKRFDSERTIFIFQK